MNETITVVLDQAEQELIGRLLIGLCMAAFASGRLEEADRKTALRLVAKLQEARQSPDERAARLARDKLN